MSNPKHGKRFLRRIDFVKYYNHEKVIDKTVAEAINEENHRYFRTDKEIENMLNVRYLDIEKQNSSEVLFM